MQLTYDANANQGVSVARQILDSDAANINTIEVKRQMLEMVVSLYKSTLFYIISQKHLRISVSFCWLGKSVYSRDY